MSSEIKKECMENANLQKDLYNSCTLLILN